MHVWLGWYLNGALFGVDELHGRVMSHGAVHQSLT